MKTQVVKQLSRAPKLAGIPVRAAIKATKSADFELTVELPDGDIRKVRIRRNLESNRLGRGGRGRGLSHPGISTFSRRQGRKKTNGGRQFTNTKFDSYQTAADWELLPDS